ncbi:MAG: PspC domain-containing protein [Paludibacteraceae bacterium]|jgi:phage shock protein PspC (stress-responsive transcriptional regulator)|nr:PspC domain-containing protein [Paludibacteraceae bacterium]HOI27732.1 PspC domain-containing protein [Paludibacteraceae bacterium]HOU68771.1 PspC domain-containing protein [Paludibacteraceae bacterium]HPH63709.1 PspC domain-containing protein [Paludibacteraceae bacterium]HQF50564.1 PspC domain-containing protein [Paludibacteraceae bacterium]
MAKQLKRSPNVVIAGVCGGIADYLDVDPTVIRIAWAILSLITGVVLGVVAYLVCCLIMPK